MKALLINGSPHEHGCTYTALRELADTLEAEGIETEIIQAGKTAHACNACASCKKTHRCVYDDLVNETAPKLAAADALVIGSPVYYASPAGGAISFMDRLFFSTPHIDKTMKVGASVVSCRRGGNTATFDALNKYFTICGMPVASSQYWNMVYGNTPEEVRQDKEGLQTMRTLGRNMAFLMKSIALGKEKLGLPEPDRVIYLDMPTELSEQMMRHREQVTHTKADIHERNEAYLRACRESAAMVVEYGGWTRIDCARDGAPRTVEDIHREVMEKLRDLLVDIK